MIQPQRSFTRFPTSVKEKKENISFWLNWYEWFAFDSDCIFWGQLWSQEASPDEDITLVWTPSFAIIQCRLLADNHCTPFLCSYRDLLHSGRYLGQISMKTGDLLSLHQQQNQEFFLSSWDIPLPCVCCGWPSVTTPACMIPPRSFKDLENEDEPLIQIETDWTSKQQISLFLSNSFPNTFSGLFCSTYRIFF